MKVKLANLNCGGTVVEGLEIEGSLSDLLKANESLMAMRAAVQKTIIEITPQAIDNLRQLVDAFMSISCESRKEVKAWHKAFLDMDTHEATHRTLSKVLDK